MLDHFEDSLIDTVDVQLAILVAELAEAFHELVVISSNFAIV